MENINFYLANRAVMVSVMLILRFQSVAEALFLRSFVYATVFVVKNKLRRLYRYIDCFFRARSLETRLVYW